jgi:hypothetical protein
MIVSRLFPIAMAVTTRLFLFSQDVMGLSQAASPSLRTETWPIVKVPIRIIPLLRINDTRLPAYSISQYAILSLHAIAGKAGHQTAMTPVTVLNILRRSIENNAEQAK